MDTPFGGRPFPLTGGREVIIPDLVMDEGDEYIAIGQERAPDYETRRDLVARAVATIFRAVQRNYPAMTLEEFRGGLEWKGGAQRLFDHVNAQNGMDGKGDGTASEDPPTPAAVAASA